MTTLSADKSRDFVLGEHNHLPVIAADIIYEGAAVGVTGSGYARPLVSGDPFRGFALQKVDNDAGAAGDKNVWVRQKGRAVLAISGLALTDVGRPVFASDDDTFTLTGLGTYIGHVVRWIASGSGEVEFDATKVEDEIVVSLPVQLAAITGNGDVVTEYTPGFAGRVKKMDFVVTTPATTASKAAALNAEIGTTNVTGGVVSLTTANCTPLGAKVLGTAVTAANAFTATDTISIEAASVTAFAEGQGNLLLVLGR